MKRKLLLAALFVVGALGFKANAQTDVTATYLVNPGFETSPIFDGTSLGSGVDPKSNAVPTDGSTLMEGAVNAYEISGWTQMTTATSDFVRVFTMPYNTTIYVKGNGADGGQAVAAPVNESSVTSENTSLLFIEANWEQNAVLGVKQNATLPAGVYKLSFDTYVTTSVSNASSLCGVKIGDKTTYKWASATNTWENQTIYFVVEADETAVEFSLGYKKIGNVGGGSSAFLFVDNLKLEQINTVSPAARSINVTDLIANANASSQFGAPWAVNNGLKNTYNTGSGYDGAAGFFEPSQWGNNSWSGEMYNNLSGLPQGLYTLKAAVQSASGVHTRLIAGGSNSVEAPANGTENGTIAADGSVVAAGSGVAGWNFVSTTEYVTDGNMKIGVYTAAWANHQWTNIDNFTLAYIPAADLFAQPLPEGGAMAANTWYYFDVEDAGGYVFSATTLADIVYTTDPAAVVNGTASDNFDATTNLSKTRYYVKSSSAQEAFTHVIDSFDLTEEISAYNDAVTAANTAKAKKMATSFKTAIETALETYGNVDTEGTQNTAMKNALQEATTALNGAVEGAATSIASYEIIASGTVSTSSLDGWTCTNNNTFHINTWSAEGNTDGSGMTTPFIENHVDKGTAAAPAYLGAGTFSYTLEGLEPGEVYYAQALIRSYSELGNTPNGPNFFINNVETNLSSEGQECTSGAAVGRYATLGGTATVGDDGKLTLGAVIASTANYNWVAFKNVSIRSLQDAYNAALADAAALDRTIPAAAYTAMMNTISTDYSALTVDNILAINGLVTTYSELVAPYAEFNEVDAVIQALYDVDSYEELVDGAHATLGTAITTAADDVEAATTIDGINQVNATLKAAGITYAGAANPTGTAEFDLTFMLTNPDVTSYWTGAWWVQPAGWYNEQNGGNFQVMQNNDMGPGGEIFMEYYANPAVTSGFTLCQKVTLPAGTFKMTGRTGARQGTSDITFSANDIDGTSIPSEGTLADSEIEFVNAEKQEVKIGLKAHANNTAKWMGINNVHLYKIPAKAYTISESDDYDATQSGAGKVMLTRTIKEGVNTLVLPFGMTQAEVEATFGAGSKVYVVSEFDGESNVKFAVQDGIVANVPCVLKATVASGADPYEIEGRTLVATAEAPVKTVNGLSMVGTYAESTEVPTDGTCSIVADGKFYLVDSDGVTVAGTRAYFQVANGGAIKALNFIFEDEEGATAIAGIGAKKAANAATYNVAGQRVGAAYKGIVIKDGKKYYQK